MCEGDRLCELILWLKKDAIDVPGRLRRMETTLRAVINQIWWLFEDLLTLCERRADFIAHAWRDSCVVVKTDM
jgi:hypothetical protein